MCRTLFAQGLSITAIGRRLGCAHDTVKRWVGTDYEPRTLFRGAAAHPENQRARAQRRYKDIGMCQDCGAKPATDRHHIDADTNNNEPQNIAFLCRRCHMQRDGRLRQLATYRDRRTAASRSEAREDDEPCGCACRVYRDD